MTNNNRRNWLAKLLSPNKAEAVRQDLKEAAAVLDAQGVQRKEAEQNTPPAQEQEATPESGNVVARVADKLAADVAAAVNGDFTQLTEDKLRALLASAMEPVDEDAEPDKTAAQESAEPQMAEDKANTETSSVAPASVAAADGERIKSLLDTLVQQTEDQGAMAQSIADLNAEVKAVKALLPTIAELVEFRARMEQQLAMRPRASEAEATQMPDTNEAKEIRKEIEEGLKGEPKLFLGHIPVKFDPK